MPGHTIGAVLRLHNGHELAVSQYEELLQEFKRINPETNPRPGERWLIPIHPAVDLRH